MPPAPWLSIAFSDTDLMLQFCLPYPKIITLHQAVPGKQKNQYKKGCMKYVGVGIVTLLISLKHYVYLSFADLINMSFGSTSVIVRICDTHTIHIHNCAGQGMPKLWLKNRFGL